MHSQSCRLFFGIPVLALDLVFINFGLYVLKAQCHLYCSNLNICKR